MRQRPKVRVAMPSAIRQIPDGSGTRENSTDAPVDVVLKVATQPAATKSGVKAKMLGEGGPNGKSDEGNDING